MDGVGRTLTNYTLTYDPGTLDVTPATPSINITWADGTYTGQVQPATISVTGADGLVAAPTTVTYFFGTDTSATGTVLPAAPINAGAYTVVATFAGDGNHAPVTAFKTITIAKAHLTVSSDNASRTYGDNNPAFTTTIIGFVNGETLATAGVTGTALVSTAATEASPVGSYTLTPTLGTLAAANYDFTVFTPGSLAVTPRAIVVKAADATKTYGQTLTLIGTEFTLAAGDLVNGDTLTSVTLASTGTAATASVAASPYAITVSAVQGIGLSNYDITYLHGELTVTKAHLTLTADNQSRLFGAVNPPLTYTLSSFVNGQTAATAGITGAPTLATDATADSPVGSYAITIDLGTLAAANYDFPIVIPGMLAVAAKATAISITWDDASYTGLAHPAIAEITGASGPSATPTLKYYAGTDATGTLLPGAPIDAGTYTAVATYEGDTNHAGFTASKTVTIGKAALAITVDSLAVTYGTAPAFTATYTGMVNGETASVFSGALSFSGADLPAGQYTITASGLSSDNYAITFATGTLTVEKKALTIIAGSTSKIYGEALTFAGTEFTADGLVYSDAIDSVTLASTGAAAFANVANSPYAITASGAVGAGLSNYEITYVAGQLTVNKAALTVTADPQTKVYGDIDPALTYQITAGQLVNGDTLIGALARAAGEDVGLYPITQDTLSAGNNYNLTFVGSILTIAKAATTTAIIGGTFTYNGQPHPGTNASTSGPGMITGTPTLAYYLASDVDRLTPLAAPVNAGIYTVVAIYAGDDNHSGSSGSATITVAARTLTVSATAGNKTYDGTTSSTVQLADDRIAGDDVVLSFTSATFADKHAAVGKTVTVFGLSLSGPASVNYVLAATAITATADIAPLHLTGSFAATDKTYDATTAATVLTRSLSGHIVTDDVLLTGGTATFADKSAGDNKTVTLTGAALAGTDAANYVLDAVGTAAASIARATLTVTALADARTYDGTTTATVHIQANRIGTDLVAVAFTSATFGDKNAATEKAVIVAGLSLVGEDAANYTLADVTSVTATATIFPLAITGSITAADKTYDGKADALLTSRTLTGVLGSDDVSLSGNTATFADRNAGTGKIVTATGLTLAGADAGNYTVNTTATTTAMIERRAITVTVAPDTKVYDGTTSAAATPTVTTGTLAPGDVAAFSEAYVTPNAGIDKLLTVIGTVLDGNNGDNYAVTLNSSTGTITPRALSVTGITAADKPYDGTTAATIDTTNAALDNVVPSTGITLVTSSASGAFVDKHAGANKTVTIAGLSLIGEDASNYGLAVSTATASIAKATLTITAASDAKTYDGTTASAATPTVSGLVSTDAVTGLAQAFADKHAGAGKTLSVTAFTVNDGNGGLNYTVSIVDGHAGVIEKATLTLTAVADAKIYDATTASTATPTASGLVAGDLLTGLTQAFTTKNVGTNKTLVISDYSLADGNGGNNYTVITIDNAAGIITAREITVSGLTALSKTYDGSLAAALDTSAAALAGVHGTDAVTLDTSNATGTFATRNAGNGIAVTASGLALTGDDAANYTLTATTAAADIRARTLTISARSDTKVYDGTAASAVAPVAAGLQTGDALTGLLQAFTSKAAGTNKTLAVTAYVLDDGNDGHNYDVVLISDTTGVITPKALTVTGITAADKTYDGTTAATLDTFAAVLVGIVGTDSVAVDVTATIGTFTSKNAGTNKTVSISGLALTGDDAGNYTLIAPNVTASITRLTISAAFTAANKAYDGTAAATIATRSVSGILGADDVSLAGGTATFVDRNPGVAKLVTGGGFTLAGDDADNYAIASFTLTTTADITAASVLARLTFYKGSAFDTSAGGDNFDSAIATDKTALLPGQTATFANYTSYAYGITGVAVDISGTLLAVSLSDFLFKVGNDNNPAGWADAPTPSALFIRPGAGVGGSTRIEFIWDNNLIKKTWLQVTVLGGLATADVFYFGNAPGETGDASADARVTIVDALGARANPDAAAAVTNAYDFNRDGKVDNLDTSLASANLTNVFNTLLLITAPIATVSSPNEIANFQPPATPVTTTMETPTTPTASSTTTPATNAPSAPIAVTSPAVSPAPSFPPAPQVTAVTPPAITSPVPVSPSTTLPPTTSKTTNSLLVTTPVKRATPRKPATLLTPSAPARPATPSTPARAAKPTKLSNPATNTKVAATATKPAAQPVAKPTKASPPPKRTLTSLFLNSLKRFGLLKK
jgi:hypothetical protein